MEAAESEVGAVDAAEKAVRGVDAEADSDMIISELATVLDILPLRRPQDAREPASEKAILDGAYCDLMSRSLRADPNRDPGRLTDGRLPSLSRSKRPAAANAFAVRGPSQSVGRTRAGW